MLKFQRSMLNECSNYQCINAFTHYGIDNSLTLEYCLLNITPKGLVI
jgi:hypothetical protein